MEYLNDADDVYKNIKEYNRIKEPKILIEFDNMIANILSNEKVNPTITDLLMKILNIQELKQITLRYSSDIDFKDL